MVKVFGFGKCWPVVFSGLCLVILTGCPGPGDRFIPMKPLLLVNREKTYVLTLQMLRIINLLT